MKAAMQSVLPNLPSSSFTTVTTPDSLAAQLTQHPCALVLWGGAHCGVCQTLQPRLAAMTAQHFPQLPLVYVDCQSSPAACAQYGVFTLPVLRLYVQGQMALEYVRAFGVVQVQQEMQQLLHRLSMI